MTKIDMFLEEGKATKDPKYYRYVFCKEILARFFVKSKSVFIFIIFDENSEHDLVFPIEDGMIEESIFYTYNKNYIVIDRVKYIITESVELIDKKPITMKEHCEISAF